jgi:hypothetical protein
MEQKQILRKFVKKTVVGTVETIINERIEKELLTKEDIEEISSCLAEDDPEEAFTSYGIITDWDGDIVSLVLDTLTEGLTDFLKDDKDEDGQYEHERLHEVLKKIEPMRIYDLDFENVVEKLTPLEQAEENKGLDG